jgi:hypothetical protein
MHKEVDASSTRGIETQIAEDIMKTLRTMFALAAVVGFSSAAFAQGNSDGQGNSDPGPDRYNEISQNPNPEAQCGTGAGSGAFGYLGKELNLGIKGSYGSSDDSPGTDGYQTGLNNSAVCGNRPD